ncbi:MAG: hypothetical protein ACYDHZ_10555 [Dehalococcoidia bacterium]
MKKIWLTLLILAALFGVLVPGCRRAGQTTAAPSQSSQPSASQPTQSISSNETVPAVPQEYQQLYSGLSSQMDQFQTKLNSLSSGSATADKTVFASELLYANGNVGEGLLNPQVMSLNRLMLDRLQVMGIKGVVMAIKYPLLSPDFPRSSEFLKFYQDIITECHSRNIKVLVEVGAIFAGTPYSPVRVDWTKYTTQSLLKGLEDQLLLVAAQVQPDYLTLANEPVTDEGLTGLKITPEDWSSFISSTAARIDRSHGILIGAGTGTWENPAYMNSIINMTGLDYIDLHIYPMGTDNLYLDRALSYSQTAHSNGKRITVSESWLYKALPQELGNGLGNSFTIMDRDYYSFWSPLDAQFIRMMINLSAISDMDFVSFFWSRYFFSYLDYQATPHNINTAKLNQLATQASMSGMQKGNLGSLGQDLQKLLDNPALTYPSK